MLAACLQLVAHTNKSSEHLLPVELQRCHMFPGRREAGHTGCRSEGCFWPAAGIDRPSSASSAGARGASDEERGSSSSIICTFALFAL